MKDRRLLIGTNNPRKLKDFQAALDGLNIVIVAPADLGMDESAPEDAATFEENSLLKAKFYWDRTHLPCITDDSGAEIKALNRAPGVRTRRWDSRAELSDDDIRAKAILAIQNIPENQRQAQLRNVVTFYSNNNQYVQAEGVIPGIIRQSDLPMTPGYPFDVILYLPPYQQWYAQIKASRPELNHRRQALQKLLPQIQQYFT